MKFINWNILSGGGSRKEQIVERIESYDADVVILTEFRQGQSGQFFCEQLQRIGLINQMMTVFKSNVHNGVLLASRHVLSKPALPELSDELSANVLACTIGKLNLIAAFCNKQSTFNAFMTYIEGMPSDETLLTGDLLHGDMRSDPNHYQNSLKRLLQNHWVDCWKKDNARSDVFCHTNLGNGGQSRPDHVFADSRFARKVINCSYDQSPLVDRLSDHAPMLYKVDV